MAAMPIRLGGALLVEFIGTFAVCLTAILAPHHADASWLPVALAGGLMLAGMVSAAAHTSGGHFNPAVTLGLLVAGRVKPVPAFSYIVIQLLAGVVASLAVYVIFGGGPGAARVVLAGTTHLSTEVTPAGGLLLETALTFFWVFVYCGTVADPRARSGLITALASGPRASVGWRSGRPWPRASSWAGRSRGHRSTPPAASAPL